MMPPEPPFMLTLEQTRSPLWVALAEHLQKKLAVYRQQNDGDKDETQTASLRGRIAEVKATLALAEFRDSAAPAKVQLR